MHHTLKAFKFDDDEFFISREKCSWIIQKVLESFLLTARYETFSAEKCSVEEIISHNS